MNELSKFLGRIEDEELRKEFSRYLERGGQIYRQLYLPEIGDKLRLVRPWTFSLYNEYRNEGMCKTLKTLGKVAPRRYDAPPVEVTLPEGTLLTVDRIYIRRGKTEYSSVTFRAVLKGVKGKPRFWAKLVDVNEIQFEPVIDGN